MEDGTLTFGKVLFLAVLAGAFGAAVYLPKLELTDKLGGNDSSAESSQGASQDEGAGKTSARNNSKTSNNGSINSKDGFVDIPEPNWQAVSKRVNADIIAGRAVIVHVIVALCDNKHQGIVPVSSSLGNGQDPANNLYWGAMYGVKGYLTKTGGWSVAGRPTCTNSMILERLILHKKIACGGSRPADVIITAEAWDGRVIKAALQRFIRLSQGRESELHRITVDNRQISFTAGGNAHLIVFVGHNGLMDFNMPTILANEESLTAPARAGVVLACRSRAYFHHLLIGNGCYALLLTNSLMAPEAYSLNAAIEGFACGKSPREIRDMAAATYSKYQKCGLGAARRIFYTDAK